MSMLSGKQSIVSPQPSDKWKKEWLRDIEKMRPKNWSMYPGSLMGQILRGKKKKKRK